MITFWIIITITSYFFQWITSNDNEFKLFKNTSPTMNFGAIDLPSNVRMEIDQRLIRNVERKHIGRAYLEYPHV